MLKCRRERQEEDLWNKCGKMKNRKKLWRKECFGKSKQQRISFLSLSLSNKKDTEPEEGATMKMSSPDRGSKTTSEGSFQPQFNKATIDV
ncbi:unnamed protein product [Caenorhabditis sp. 36 PRJEB53466]|nr:unnamed protein product [Caenorhabditis sp. 36 PRJEB53466]